ncbi:MAG: hypothetical protein A2048_06510 [Deltaproteobacteria bacterium GWA2_45_12]|nr:MAG: hypothetical protein A2048_06510 [Deltaproteobacteria bacterium GWA2_45_12]
MNEITPLKSKARSWGEMIKAQVQSGQSIQVFCEGRQIKTYAFYYWKKKLRDLPPSGPSRFIPIPRAAYSAEKFPRIHLPNGVQIELGAGLESGVVNQFLRGLCGVGNPMPKGGHSEKP